MPCSKREALARLCSYVVTAFKFFFLYFYLFSIFVVKLLISIIRYIFRNEDDDYDYSVLYEDDQEEEEDLEEDEDEEEDDVKTEDESLDQDELDVYSYSHVERDHLVADIVNSGDTLIFRRENGDEEQNFGHSHSNSYESAFEDPLESFQDDFTVEDCHTSESDLEEDEKNVNCDHIQEVEHVRRFGSNEDTQFKADISQGENEERKLKEEVKQDASEFTRDENFLIFAPPKSEAKKVVQVLEREPEEIFGDSCTVGSTSKSSSEWRSSLRDSATEDPFSSSSRRSCPKWESYTVYQKYDEEMMFLDRISAQKLQETESLKSFLVEPRSISQRIVHKITTTKKQKSQDRIYQNRYSELEAAYVAQVCLAWEAINWNYTNFRRKQAARRGEVDPGCPALVAQQFQQFQVLLQRYIENEPYERGRRPEIYARMRRVAPKLLLVPEYHDYEEENQGEEIDSPRIPSDAFLSILEDCILTFKDFLKADKESHYHVLAALWKGRKTGSIDPALIQVIKKHNKKMKSKLKELKRPRICFKKRKLPREEEMEILMGIIDLTIVSRVLRMVDITQEQLHWCEGKMGKLRILEGSLRRDSSPLFFPAHCDDIESRDPT